MQPTLLVIDDDAAQFDYYADALSTFNLKMFHAPDGYAGLRKISEQYYDLVLLDISMPKMSGIDLLRAVSQMPQLTLPLTVIISSLNQKDLIMEALMLGASAYLLKPIEAEALKNLVKQYISTLEEMRQAQPDEKNAKPPVAAAQAKTEQASEIPAGSDAFSKTPAQAKKSQFASLSQAMAQMVFQKTTGTLAVETQVGVGQLKYFRGKLQKVDFCGQSGIDALEMMRKLPPLSITIEP